MGGCSPAPAGFRNTTVVSGCTPSIHSPTATPRQKHSHLIVVRYASGPLLRQRDRFSANVSSWACRCATTPAVRIGGSTLRTERGALERQQRERYSRPDRERARREQP